MLDIGDSQAYKYAMANNPEQELQDPERRLIVFDRLLIRRLEAERKKRDLPSISSTIRTILREALSK